MSASTTDWACVAGALSSGKKRVSAISSPPATEPSSEAALFPAMLAAIVARAAAEQDLPAAAKPENGALLYFRAEAGDAGTSPGTGASSVTVSTAINDGNGRLLTGETARKVVLDERGTYRLEESSWSEDHYDHSSARSTAQAHGTWSWQPAAAAPQGTAATAPKPKPKQACAKCGAGHATFSAAMTCAVKCGGVPPPQPVVRPPPTGVVTLTGTCQGAVASHAEDDAHRDDGLALQTSSSKAVEVHRLEIVV